MENHVYVSLSLFLHCYPLQFVTLKCRSLASKIKLEHVGLDVNSYSVNVLALQETRMVAGSNPIKVPHTQAMLYTLNRGKGFVVGKRHLTLPYLQTSHVISDHVAVVSFHFGRSDPPISVVIAYRRTSTHCTANPQLREDFYYQLQAAVDTIPKREVTVLMGDMNAKVGNRCSIGTYSCLGAWSKRYHNDNGEAFLEFCD